MKPCSTPFFSLNGHAEKTIAGKLSARRCVSSQFNIGENPRICVQSNVAVAEFGLDHGPRFVGIEHAVEQTLAQQCGIRSR